MDPSFIEVQGNKRRKSTSTGFSSVLPEKILLDCTKVKTDQTLFLDRFLADSKNVDNDLLQRISKLPEETCKITELWTKKKGELFILLHIFNQISEVTENQDNTYDLLLNSLKCIKELLKNQI